jgi:tetratricopeptide (TPR) repeat protein
MIDIFVTILLINLGDLEIMNSNKFATRLIIVASISCIHLSLPGIGYSLQPDSLIVQKSESSEEESDTDKLYREARKKLKESQRTETSQALILLNQVVDMIPNEPCVYYYRADFFRKNGNISDAARDYSHSTKLAPRMYIFHREKANFYYEIHDNRKAIDAYSEIIKYAKYLQNDYLIETYEHRANLYIKVGNSLQAIQDYDIAADLSIRQVHFLKILDTLGNEAAHAQYPQNVQDNNIYDNNLDYCTEKMFRIWFGRDGSSEKDGESRLASIYYKRGTIKSKRDKAGAIRDLQKALVIFIKLSDKTNEQKIRAAINSLR